MKNNKLNINIFMYILLIIMLVVLINDYITYFFNINYFVSIIISVLILIFPIIKTKQKLNITKDFHKSDIVFFILLLGIMIITIPFADRSFDTYNYHLYLQENPFGKKLKYDLFAGKIFNTYTYAFSDRLFYIFRYFLGYRLGLILNYLILIAIYYQVKTIVTKLLSKDKNINELIITLISTFAVLSLSVVDIVDSYYIDLISIVLLLEALKIALFSNKLKEKDQLNTYIFGYIGLLFGLSFATKISNAIPVIVIFIIYIIKNRNIWKCLTIKNTITTLLLFILPFILYMSYTYIETGNPFFPFYNTIFHSKYFANTNWMDTRFGPNRFLGVLVWPIIIMYQPYRCVDTSIVEPMWCIGYLASIIYLLYYFIKWLRKDKNIDKNKLTYSIVVIIMYLVWAKFLLGYSRYGLIVLILGAINAYILLYDVIKNKKYILTSILIMSLLYNYAYSGYNYMFDQEDWIYNNLFNNGTYHYKYNLENIFYKNIKKVEFEENSTWAVVYDNSALLQSINDEMPMINLFELTYLKYKSAYKNNYTIKMINKELDKYSNIYSAVDTTDLDLFIESLNTYGYKISSVEDVITFNQLTKKNHYVYIFKIEKDNDSNTSEKTFNNNILIDLNNEEEINLFIGNAKIANHYYSEDYYVTVFGNKNDEKEELDTIKVTPSGDMISFYYQNTEEYDNISLEITDKDNKENESLWATVILVDN